MNILFLSKTPVSNAPIRLANLFNKYDPDISCISLSFFTSSIQMPHHVFWKKPSISSEEMEKFRSLIEWADILHIHNDIPCNNHTMFQIIRDSGIPTVFQIHSAVEIIEETYKYIQSNIPIQKLLCIAQYHTVFCSLPHDTVRNVVDIYDQCLLPKYNDHTKLHITYSPSNTKSMKHVETGRLSSWGYKGFQDTQPILKRLTDDGYITHEIFHHRPFLEMIVERNKGDMHIDDLRTGSYHLSSLEGLSQGKVVLCFLESWMQDFLCRFLECEAITLPWVNTTYHTLRQNIIELCKDTNKVKEIQQKSRQWMETYWTPMMIIENYKRIYEEIV